MKIALRELKSNDITDIKEIKYISKLLRRKFKTNNTINDALNHHVKINNNFWNYCKETFESKERVLMNFDESACYKHSKIALKLKRKNKSFEYSSWLKRLKNPTTELDQSPRTYAELTKTIKKMKSGASPCPLDQVSIIAFQKCSALRFRLLRIIHHCWRHKVLPSCWRNAVAVLAYKKGIPKDPSNFRPISLDPVLLKVYHSIIRDRLYNFVSSNNYIESTIQEGFWSDISGTIEHTETLTYLLRHAIKTKELSSYTYRFEKYFWRSSPSIFTKNFVIS